MNEWGMHGVCMGQACKTPNPKILKICVDLACARAGVNARSVADVKLFNDIFSECGRGYSTLAAEGLRVGFPRNFWEDIGEEAGSLPR